LQVVENLRQEREVACDWSPAFIKGANEPLPEAEIVIDHFHVVKSINQAVDKARRQEATTNPLLRSTRYIFLKNRRNHTGRQTEMINQLSLSSLNLKTVKTNLNSIQTILHMLTGKLGFSRNHTACLTHWIS
jgi:transposase